MHCSAPVWQGSWVSFQSGPFRSWFILFYSASGHSKNNEDLRQQISELEEKLPVLVAEKAAAQSGVEELRKKLEMSEQKKLEMSELLLQQVRGCGLLHQGIHHTVSSIRVGDGQPSAGRIQSSSWFSHKTLQSLLNAGA